MGFVSKNVIFVTGAFVTNRGWDPWIKYFQEWGYHAVAPAWPFKEGDPAELRAKHERNEDHELAALSLSQVVDHFSAVARSFEERPVVIGHSTGGLITQILLNRDLASAAVGIHSLPPLGVIPYEWSFLRAGWRSLGFFTSTKHTYLMSFKKWQYAFTNGMPLAVQKRAYEENAIPESKVLARGALTKAAEVDFDKPHAPLLLTSGSLDHIIPAHLNLRNYKRYNKNNGSVIAYQDFPGRTHFVLGQDTWKEDADYILQWLEAERKASAA